MAGHVPTVIDTLSHASDFFFGESLTESDRIKAAQRQVDHEARRTEGRAWMAEQAAAKSRQRIESMMNSPTVQARMASGAGDTAIRRELSRAQRLEDRAGRLDAAATRQADAADNLTEAQATLSSLETAATIADATSAAAYAINEGDGITIADRLRESELQLKESQRSTDRALGNKSSTQRNAAVDEQMRQLQARAQMAMTTSSIHGRNATTAAAARPPYTTAPRQMQRPVAATASPLSSSLSCAAAAAAASSSHPSDEGGSVPTDEELAARLAGIKKH